MFPISPKAEKFKKSIAGLSLASNCSKFTIACMLVRVLFHVDRALKLFRYLRTTEVIIFLADFQLSMSLLVHVNTGGVDVFDDTAHTFIGAVLSDDAIKRLLLNAL